MLVLVLTLPDGNEQYGAHIEANGRYQFPHVAEGSASLQAWTRLIEAAPPRLELAIPAGQSVRQDIELAAPATK